MSEHGQFITQVWCLPGSSKASLSVFSPDGDSAVVFLDRVQVEQTIMALQEALRRMADSQDADTGGER